MSEAGSPPVQPPPASGAAPGADLPSLFKQRNFSALIWGQLISILGERLTYIALLGLLAEHTNHFEKAGSSWLLSLLANVMLAPVLMFAPFTGAWVDRMNLKRVLITTDTLRAVIVGLIPVLYLMTGHTLPVFALVFLLFTCNVLFLPAKSAITPEIVSGPQLLSANAFLAGAGIAATAIGAPLGGWIVDHWGWAIAMYINAVTYLVSVIALAVLRYRAPKVEEAGPEVSVGNYLAEVREGWSLVRSSVPVGVALIALGAVWLGGGFFHVAGNQHIQRAASVPGMERVGILILILGVGAALGTWWVNHQGRRLSQPLLLGIGLMLISVGVVAFAVSSRFAVFSIAAFFVGIAVAPSFVLTETLLQVGTPVRQRGRVFSARDFIMRLLFLISVTLAAWLTDAFGTRTTLLIASGLTIGAGLLTIWYGGRAGPWKNLQAQPGSAPAGAGPL